MWLKIVGAGIIVIALALLASAWGDRRWQERTRELVERLEATAEAAPVADANASLPASVRRYLDLVLPDPVSSVGGARIVHTGSFDMGGDTPNWRPFRSSQYVQTSAPGFVWDARIRTAPGVNVYVHDAYVAGTGRLSASVAGLLTVMEAPSGPELDEGEALRYLAESPWYPTALLPGGSVRWEAIDDAHARAILADGNLEVALRFAFSDDGLVASVYAEERYRDVRGLLEATPWQGRFWRYERRNGILVPTEGEVAWIMPDGPRPYWRGTIEQIAYLPHR